MPCCLSLPFVKRKLVCVLLWIAFGFLCAYLAWSWDETLKNNPEYWWSPLMWTIVYNRFLIWWVVLILWIITVHPLWFRILPAFRWIAAWAIVSLDLAIWSMISWWENAWNIFWLTILVWAVYWMIIDIIATKVAWEWTNLLDFSTCNKPKSAPKKKK